jgi:acetyl-CoA acetyltransferase
VRQPYGAIIGIGELKPVRSTTGATTLGMIAEVARLAVADAGLEPGAIDGLLVGPQVGETPQHVPATVAEYLGLRPAMANVVDLGGASGAGMVWRAAAAIAAGMCETVLCVLANCREAEPPRSPNRNPIREFDVPFGASGANATYAMIKQRHMAEFGSADADFALIAAAARANAQRNPDAMFYGKPASVADVLASPLIASPLHLFEIVMPVAGGAAVVVSSAAAKGRQQPAVHLLGAGEKVTHRALSQAPSLTSGPLQPAIARALAQAGAEIGEIDILSLYDCYSIMVATTLEDAGLAAPGRFGDWLREADLNRLNPHGGQLGFGQPDLAGGMTHIVEAVRQLRGNTPMRQIANARLALVTGNGATMSEATALVLGAAA